MCISCVFTEPFSNWLDSGAIYDGTNSTVSGLPTYQPGLWTAPESPAEDKVSLVVMGLYSRFPEYVKKC